MELWSMTAKGFSAIFSTEDSDSAPFSSAFPYKGNVTSKDNDQHLQVARKILEQECHAPRKSHNKTNRAEGRRATSAHKSAISVHLRGTKSALGELRPQKWPPTFLDNVEDMHPNGLCFIKAPETKKQHCC